MTARARGLSRMRSLSAPSSAAANAAGPSLGHRPGEHQNTTQKHAVGRDYGGDLAVLA